VNRSPIEFRIRQNRHWDVGRIVEFAHLADVVAFVVENGWVKVEVTG